MVRTSQSIGRTAARLVVDGEPSGRAGGPAAPVAPVVASASKAAPVVSVASAVRAAPAVHVASECGAAPAQAAPVARVAPPGRVRARPLLVTSDPDLLDDLLRLAGDAGVTPDVAPDPAGARSWFRRADRVFVGADMVEPCSRARLPRRSGVIVVMPHSRLDCTASTSRTGRSGDVAGDAGSGMHRERIGGAESRPGGPPDADWSAVQRLGAEHVAVLPAAEPWLVQQLASVDSTGFGADGLGVPAFGGSAVAEFSPSSRADMAASAGAAGWTRPTGMSRTAGTAGMAGAAGTADTAGVAGAVDIDGVAGRPGDSRDALDLVGPPGPVDATGVAGFAALADALGPVDATGVAGVAALANVPGSLDAWGSVGAPAFVDAGVDMPRSIDPAGPWAADGWSGASPRGRVVAVLGGRGGAGASVLAGASAVTAARRGLRTLLVDADPLGGGVDLVLGWESLDGLRWPALSQASGEVPAPAFVEALPGRSDLVILSWDRGEPMTVPPEAMLTALDAGRRGRDLTVIDLPRRLDQSSMLALEAADQAYLVVPAELRACAAAARVAAVAAPHCAALSVVVRQPGPAGLAVKEVIEALRLPYAGTVRSEPRLRTAWERGEPPAANGRGSLATLCAKLLDDVVPTGVSSARATRTTEPNVRPTAHEESA
jgi:secretion/DNA translocation related CpaE-like protein